MLALQQFFCGQVSFSDPDHRTLERLQGIDVTVSGFNKYSELDLCHRYRIIQVRLSLAIYGRSYQPVDRPVLQL